METISTSENKRKIRGIFTSKAEEEVVHDYTIQLTDELKSALHSQGTGSFHPELIVGRSDILDFDDVDNLSKHINEEWGWFLTFSSYDYNSSLTTLYNKASHIKGPALLILKTTSKQIFGAFLSEQPCVSGGYYGTSQSFLFQCRPNFKVYRSTGKDHDFIFGSPIALLLGKSDTSANGALQLNSSLTQGKTTDCPTYGNPPLVPEFNFKIKILELWHFGLPA